MITSYSPLHGKNASSLATHLARYFFLSLLLAASAAAQNKEPDDWFGGFGGENLVRLNATEKVLPDYPAEAVSKGVAGIVEVRIGVDDDGVVRRVKVPPGLHPLLRKAAVLAAKRWRFLPLPGPMGEGRYFTHRLTFHFRIEDGRGWVELYNPPHETPAGVRLREATYRTVATEWEKWEDATNDYDN